MKKTEIRCKARPKLESGFWRQFEVTVKHLPGVLEDVSEAYRIDICCVGHQQPPMTKDGSRFSEQISLIRKGAPDQRIPVHCAMNTTDDYARRDCDGHTYLVPLVDPPVGAALLSAN